MKRKINKRVNRKLHFTVAPALKHALCGMPNPALTEDMKAVTCRLCKHLMRTLKLGKRRRGARKTELLSSQNPNAHVKLANEGQTSCIKRSGG